MRAYRISRRWIVALGVAGLGLAWGCGGLLPPELVYDLHVDPILPEGRGDYTIDLEDSAMVFSHEGLLIRVRHVQDPELNELFPPRYDGLHINPYTRAEIDSDLGYKPTRFTVFEVEIINVTYSKIEFDPAKAVMEAGGETYRYYDPGREGAVAFGGNNFTKYYKMELGTSGNEREINLERMGIIYKTIFHRGRPIFREDRQKGMLVFEPLLPENDELLLTFNEFVLSFDASGKPEETIDVEFRFKVDQGVREVDAAQGAG